jgi:DNA polymerase-3 subunit alpha
MYSIGVGVSTPREICRHAARSGFHTVALADVGGTWGYVEFHRAAGHFGLKPIYGITLGFSPDGANPDTDIVLLALDRTGLRHICDLTSLFDPDQAAGASVSTEDLRKRNDGLVCIAAPRVDSFRSGSSLVVKDPERRRKELVALRRRFGDRLFLGFTPGNEETIRPWLTASGEEGIAKVLVQDVRYVGFRHYSFVTQDSPSPGEPPDTSTETAATPVDLYRFLSLGEVGGWYNEYPDAYANVSMIASLVQPDLLDRLDTVALAPEAQTLFDGGGDYQAQLEELAVDRLEAALAGAGGDDSDRYRMILDQELEAIKRAGIAESFLRFHEIVARLDELGVTVGPATGLRLQSLCAWLLGITRFDPYGADDRFVADLESDPLRRKILDLQIASGDRPVASGVIRQLFGNDFVGYLPTVEHVTPVRALRVAGSEIDIDDDDFAGILRIAGEHPGVSLQKLCEENREIGRLYRRSAAVRELFQTAAAIEGLPLGFIKAKRTLIASSAPLKHFIGHAVYPDSAALFFQSTREAFPTESVFRIDISTLTALVVCAGVQQFLATETPSPLLWSRPESSDGPPRALFAHISDDDTFGIYLMESALTKRLAGEFSLETLDDLANFLALMRARRGDRSFARRVEEFKREAPAEDRSDPEISFVLNDTNGWILFEDQLRAILSALTALPGREVLGLFRRFGEREAGRLGALRRDFMTAAAEADVPMETAAGWYNRLLFYYRRVLDRQHVLADALLVYRMLYLKHLHRAEFIAALLNAHHNHRSRLETYMGIAESEGLLLSAHVNRSGRRYRPENGLIRAPLSRIPGLGDDAADAIIRTRENGNFIDLKDFISRVPAEIVTNEQIEAIVSAGAIDTAAQLGKSQKTSDFNEIGASSQSDTGPGQTDLFRDNVKGPINTGARRLVPEAPQTKKDGNIRSGFTVLPNIAEFYPHPVAARVELVGRIRDLRSFRTSSGNETSFFVLFDASASVPVFAPSEQIGQAGEPLVDGNRVLVRGFVRIRDRRKVCNAVEVQAEGGAISDGETSSDEPPEGNP